MLYLQQDEQFMRLALEQSHIAFTMGEVPVGAVIVRSDEIIAVGYNTRETTRTALGHAEIMAIEKACATVGDWRLTGCTIYVTLEPCPMCMGAILNARLDRVVYGAADGLSGCCGSVIHLADCGLGHRPPVKGGILAAECGRLVSEFFASRR